MNARTKAIIGGVSASAVLMLLYATIVSFLNSPEHAFEQFVLLQPYMTLLIVGFGIQVGLMIYLKSREKECHAAMAPTIASGGISTGVMIACCLHHATDILPLIGLAAAATFLTQYQTWFLLIGILSNVAGIGYLIYAISKHGGKK